MVKQISGIKGVEEVRARHYVEYWGLRCILGVFRIAGLDRASRMGGWLGRTVGPRTKPHRTALANLHEAFPDWADAKVRKTALDMWDNFGRTAAEYAHLDKLLPYKNDGRILVEGEEIIDQSIAAGKGVIFFSGHFANWELMATCIRERGHKLNGVYRSANNPLVNNWMVRQRENFQFDVQMPKGRQGARGLVKVMRNKESIAMLVDQKMNDGINVPFFGRLAPTAPAAAQFAVKYGCAMVPVHIRRTKGAHFKAIFFAPLEFKLTGNQKSDMENLTAQYTLFMEEQIRAEPGQWMWMHNRWTNPGGKRTKNFARA